MDLGLKGKVVLITGGSEGIGRATALRFAAEGATVALCARRAEPLAAVERELAATGATVFAFQGDANDEASMARFVAQTQERFGHIDILVNNAGGSAQMPFNTIDMERWRDDVEVKLFTPLRMIRLVLPQMRARKSGVIINLTMSAAAAPEANQMPTVVSRQAGASLAKALSKELGPDGIRVNVACVGKIKTPQQERSAARKGLSVADHYERTAKNVPLRRLGEPEDLANAIVFLCSEPANYITGTCLNVDGGLSGLL